MNAYLQPPETPAKSLSVLSPSNVRCAFAIEEKG